MSSIRNEAESTTIVYDRERRPDAPIPRPGVQLRKGRVAVTDPQVDFLSPKGVTWGVVGKNVAEVEVAVVGDAVAAARLPGFDGYAAAITNYRFLASDLWSTDEAVRRLVALG